MVQDAMAVETHLADEGASDEPDPWGVRFAVEGDIMPTTHIAGQVALLIGMGDFLRIIETKGQVILLAAAPDVIRIYCQLLIVRCHIITT